MRRLLALAFALGACGDDGGPAPGSDAGTAPSLASLASLVAFEGHATHVNELTLPDGASLEGATVAAEPGAPLEVVAQECVAARCGLVLRILDVVPNRGVGVPSPIDATNHFLEVTLAGGERYRALLAVYPLDALTNAAGNRATVTQPVVLASSLDAQPGSEFVAATAAPVRWVVFGDARMAGTFTLSPSPEGPRAGGAPGGGPGEAGGGARGGAAGLDGAGGGGGAGLLPGNPGDGSGGAPGAGGAGGVPVDEPAGACLADFARTDCGGGGGGGSAGPGGHGGGGLLLVALGDLRMSEGELDLGGGAGSGGGGGGGAGQALLAGSGEVTAPTVRADGGEAEAPGGAGGGSAARVDGAAPGVRVALSAVPPITRAPSLRIEGEAPAGRVDVRAAGVSRATAPVVDGAFAVDVPLQPGLNRLQLVWVDEGGAETRLWLGNNIELGSVGGSPQPLPTGTTLDVVYLGP